MSGKAPGWLTDRPIAHRGLHNAAKGVVENTLGAAEAAIEAACAIECDVQLSRDGEAMVFHDPALDRLTRGRGNVSQKSAAELHSIPLRDSSERIPTLSQLLARIAGRTPLICEIKSRFDGDLRLTERVAALARDYAGPIAFKSFDPAPIAHLRAAHPAVAPLGIVAEASYRGRYWRALSPKQKEACEAFLHYPQTQPDFLSWCVEDLPHPTPFLLRSVERLPVMTWTVRTAEQREAAARWADQAVFENA
ncbi:MAG TPA: glycerophosphodiester phosphodiesterase family protein [Roseiarcus sp.]